MPDTEQELFDSAMSEEPSVALVKVVDEPEQQEADTQQKPETNRDDKGRFTPSSTDKVRPDVVAETKPELSKVEKPDDRSERGEIPAWRLREEAEAKREWQAKADAAHREAEDARRQMAAFQQQLATFQQQAQEKNNPPPDMYADPEGYQRHQAMQYQQGLRQQAVSFSEQLARVKFGDELYDKAEQEIARHVQMNPRDPIVHVIQNSSQPAFELVRWYQQQEANKRLAGKSIDDLLKEEREKALNDPAFLAQAIERAKATAKPVHSQANSTIPSLNRTTAAAIDSGAEDESDSALFKSAISR
jgi:hypothetical protein